jgi:hypothetical protein
MFKCLFDSARSTEPHNSKQANEVLQSLIDVTQPQVECYLFMRQRLGDLKIQTVFNRGRDNIFKGDLYFFDELCGIYPTREEAMRAGRNWGKYTFGIFQMGYPPDQIPQLIARGDLSQIVIGGWQYPFNDENYQKNRNFNPNLLPQTPPAQARGSSPS